MIEKAESAGASGSVLRDARFSAPQDEGVTRFGPEE
jgi:hypothetical protein